MGCKSNTEGLGYVAVAGLPLPDAATDNGDENVAVTAAHASDGVKEKKRKKNEILDGPSNNTLSVAASDRSKPETDIIISTSKNSSITAKYDAVETYTNHNQVNNFE